jgi:hypothetical protein
LKPGYIQDFRATALTSRGLTVQKTIIAGF